LYWFTVKVMATKLRRAPLFGADGCLGIPVVKASHGRAVETPNKILTMDNLQNGSHTHYRKSPHSSTGRKSTPSTPSKAVNFRDNSENEKEREKYLTAKYGAHQMALIRKRLKVEMWMFDQLQELQDSQEEELDIDLDEILDIEDEIERKIFIKKMLTESKSSKEIINKFVDDLLERAKTL